MLEIPILGRNVGVRFVSDKELANLAKDTDCLGCYQAETIYLSSSIPEELSRRVLMHEIAHAVLSISGLSNLLEDRQEEAVCDAFESYLDVIRNPEVIKFISRREDN